jgi:hypothetical protein
MDVCSDSHKQALRQRKWTANGPPTIIVHRELLKVVLFVQRARHDIYETSIHSGTVLRASGIIDLSHTTSGRPRCQIR